MFLKSPYLDFGIENCILHTLGIHSQLIPEKISYFVLLCIPLPCSEYDNAPTKQCYSQRWNPHFLQYSSPSDIVFHNANTKYPALNLTTNSRSRHTSSSKREFVLTSELAWEWRRSHKPTKATEPRVQKLQLINTKWKLNWHLAGIYHHI